MKIVKKNTHSKKNIIVVVVVLILCIIGLFAYGKDANITPTPAPAPDECYTLDLDVEHLKIEDDSIKITPTPTSTPSPTPIIITIEDINNGFGETKEDLEILTLIDYDDCFSLATRRDKAYYLIDYDSKIMVEFSKGGTSVIIYAIEGNLTDGLYTYNRDGELSEGYYQNSKSSRGIIYRYSKPGVTEYDSYGTTSISGALSELKKKYN